MRWDNPTRQALFGEPLPTLPTLLFLPWRNLSGRGLDGAARKQLTMTHMGNLKYYLTIAVVAYIGTKVIDAILAKVMPASAPAK